MKLNILLWDLIKIVVSLQVSYKTCHHNYVPTRWNILDLDTSTLQNYASSLSKLQHTHMYNNNYLQNKQTYFEYFYHLMMNEAQARDYETLMGWSRVLLYFIESTMRRLNPRAPAIPYWDWTNLSDNVFNSKLFGSGSEKNICLDDGIFKDFRFCDFSRFKPESICVKRLSHPDFSFTKDQKQLLLSQTTIGHFGYRLYGLLNSFSYAFTGEVDIFKLYQDPIFLSILAYNDKIFTEWLQTTEKVYQQPKIKNIVLQAWNITVDQANFIHRGHCIAYL